MELKSRAASSWALEHRSPCMLNGRYHLGFKPSKHQKDLGIALATADSVQSELPVRAQEQAQGADLIEQGFGALDVTTLHQSLMPEHKKA